MIFDLNHCGTVDHAVAVEQMHKCASISLSNFFEWMLVSLSQAQGLNPETETVPEPELEPEPGNRVKTEWLNGRLAMSNTCMIV